MADPRYTHISEMALARVWCGGRKIFIGSLLLTPDWIRPDAVACTGKSNNTFVHMIVEPRWDRDLPTCPDCAVLRDYAETNASKV